MSDITIDQSQTVLLAAVAQAGRSMRACLWAGLVAALVLSTACAGPADHSTTEVDVAVPTRPDPSDPTIAKRPYSPEQIRSNMPVGSWTEYLVEQSGRPRVLTVSSVVSADEQGVTLTNQVNSEVGDPMGPPVEQKDTWVALQHHATFPLEATTVTEEQVQLPSGAWDCWVYKVVSTTEDGAEQVNIFHFAKDKPGAPVQYEQLVEGKRVFCMTLVGLGEKPAH